MFDNKPAPGEAGFQITRMKLLFAGILLCCAACANSAHLELARDDYGFDFFFFVRQWDPSFCDHHQCRKYPKVTDFTVHGLWPNFANGSYPAFCNAGQPFDPSYIQDLLPELKKAWPSFAKSDNSFWAHEWNKHGTCAGGVFQTEREYFATVLRLHKQYDLLSALEAAGINPSPTKQYNSVQLQQAIKNDPRIGALPYLDCIEGDLSEVKLCLTPTLKIIDCDKFPLSKNKRRACQQVILEPAHDHTEA